MAGMNLHQAGISPPLCQHGRHALRYCPDCAVMVANMQENELSGNDGLLMRYYNDNGVDQLQCLHCGHSTFMRLIREQWSRKEMVQTQYRDELREGTENVHADISSAEYDDDLDATTWSCDNCGREVIGTHTRQLLSDMDKEPY